MKSLVKKLSISLPANLAQFVVDYQSAHGYETKSQVFQEALKLLRVKELEAEYLAANAEIDPSFDITSTDGIDDETW